MALLGRSEPKACKFGQCLSATLMPLLRDEWRACSRWVPGLPDLVIWITQNYPQTRASTVLPLMAMHFAVATICTITLSSLSRGRGGHGSLRHP